MSNFFVIIGFALTAAVLTVFLKESRAPAFAVIMAVTGGAIIFIVLLPRIGEIFEIFKVLADRAGLNRMYLQVILKILAMSYLAEFASQVCRDAGVGALAAKIDLAAKVMVMILALPIMVSILDTILQVLP